jgi:hydrogenase maturation protein HypF
VVQGVGFRPFVYRLAKSLSLSGWVKNTARGVEIEYEGAPESLLAFERRLREETPPLAQIASFEAEAIGPNGKTGFQILESEGAERQAALIPADVALCEACAAEIVDPGDRRFRYPFTNCTDCGPRFTIIEGLPYDRPKTTMRLFAMCPECEREYHEPGDRRFHAQPNACPECGPSLFLDERPLAAEEALRETGRLLREGRILAIKGLGGYHLACDARSPGALETLRRRKGRGEKPFALMCESLEEVRRIALTDARLESLLASPQSPIVLLPRREGSGIAPAVAPKNRYLGVMLPYTPLHRLLFGQSPKTLVMTSGNLAEEPIEHRDDSARARLGPIADHFLTHNREIFVPCDDSVVRPLRGQAMLLRRARGYVPRPLALPFDSPEVLACGAEQKNTFCLLQGRSALLSQHIGDLDNVETLEYYGRAIAHFLRLFKARPRFVAYDLHPGYFSSQWALAQEGMEKIGVQHHHAHAVSAMVDNELAGPVLALTFDGTGYGPDGTVWGGEFLVADERDFRRAAHLRLLPLPGGEASIRRPVRMGFCLLYQALGEEAFALRDQLLPALPETEARVIARQIERRLNTPLTSSLGRVFDGVSALLGGSAVATYEGQAAVELEMLAGTPSAASRASPYEFEITEEGEKRVVDLLPAVRQIVHDLRARRARELTALRFHRTLVAVCVRVCQLLRSEGAPADVALTGGVFQNVLLSEWLAAELERAGFRPHLHRRVPPNDGGLSLGQAVIAARRVMG